MRLFPSIPSLKISFLYLEGKSWCQCKVAYPQPGLQMFELQRHPLACKSRAVYVDPSWTRCSMNLVH